MPSAREDENYVSVIIARVYVEISEYFSKHTELFRGHLSKEPFEKNLRKSRFTVMMAIMADDLIFGDVVAEKDKKDNVVIKWIKSLTHPKSSDHRIRCMNVAQKKCVGIFTDITNYVKSLNGQDFQENHITHVVQLLHTFFNEMKLKRCENGFSFQPNFKIKFSVYVCKCAANEFIELRQTFRKTTDPLARIRSDKPMLLQLFKDTYFDIEKEEMAAKMFLDMLSKWIKETVLRDQGRLIADKIVNSTDRSFSNQAKISQPCS